MESYLSGEIFVCLSQCQRAVVCRRCAQEQGSGVACQACANLPKDVRGLTIGEFQAMSEFLDLGMELRPESEEETARVAANLCIACLETCTEVQYRADDIFVCPVECGGTVMLCRACFASYGDGEFRCPGCKLLLRTRLGTRAGATPKGEYTGMAELPSPGCVQAGYQCYAAAVATACNWAVGTDMTADDAMHLYLMSGKATGQAFEAYRKSFTAAQEKIGATASIGEVHEEMQKIPLGWAALEYAVDGCGVPEFPEGVPFFYFPELTGEILVEACAKGVPVMWSTAMHWLVAYGCETDPEGDVIVVHSFDPSTGIPDIARWDEVSRKAGEGYVVGISGI
ncbi:hypothetical protein [Streptomyces sp. WAC06614]|uniref:hypothetical protein n=1 Tax=Streptomyces sp. WAC06614 TaxID=2487416 RepID=UPI000F7A5D8E|nr:hypothetical protein [Streptomyces sp. WAC06614]RSS81834.1 hypothetical protein EF918_08880 [Streptomyces sp. WAC06614]